MHIPIVNRRAHVNVIERGRNVLGGAKVAVLGLARDCDSKLAFSLSLIESLEEYAAETTTLLLENDSQDATRRSLQVWCARNQDARNLTALNLDTDRMESIRCPDRGSRMAHLRNILLARFVAMHKARPFDYVVVLDMDLHYYSFEGVLHSLGLHGWDMLGANGVLFQDRLSVRNYPLQYDAWAFREVTYDPLSCAEVNPRRYLRGQPPVPVLSCFGGLGIYRANAYARSSYTGGDCEHVGFHRTMRQNGYGRHLLNPTMVTYYNWSEAICRDGTTNCGFGTHEI